MKKLVVLFVFCYILTFVNAYTNFTNYSLYKLYPKNINQINVLKKLQNDEIRFDFWNDQISTSNYVNIMVAPEDKSYLDNILVVNNIDNEIMIQNIQSAIDTEKVNSYTKNNLRSMTWEAYYNLDDIYSWMNDLISAYPDVTESILGGHSYENREIRGIKISHGSGKRAVFIEGGIHSREWISPATVCFILNELLTSDNVDIKAAVEEFDWYIFPVTNPDGYVWTHTSNRMWRKNRRPVGNQYGIDLNRNWNNNWLVVGASSNPASDSYAGSGPFSEPETRSLSTYIRSIGDQIDLYLSFHSFGQMLLLPFGNSTEPYGNYHDALNIGRRAMGALSVRYGTRYVSGNIAETIYEAAGGSVDWVKEHLKVPLVYCYELRDQGAYGMVLPPEQILPTALETMDSVIDIIYQAKRFGYMNNGMQFSGSLTMISVILITILFR